MGSAEDGFQREQGVTFTTAERVFDDPFASEEIDDTVDYGDERFITIGMAGLEIIVVWTERRGVVRLISARRATRWEANEYFEGR